jgi:hypothetical protein
MSDPGSDLEAWAATYREVRRPSPARRRAIGAAVVAGAAAQDRQIHRQRWLGLAVVIAAGLIGVLALGRLLDGRTVRAGAGNEPSLVPYSVSAGEDDRAHELRDGEATPRPEPSDPGPVVPGAVPAEGMQAEPGKGRAAKATSRDAAEPRRPASPSAEPAAPAPQGLDDLESMRLLRDAERRLESDAAASLRLLERHEQRFPSSSLALEREALIVIALCRVGRVAAGRERQRAFLRANDGSAYAARVASACDASSALNP